MFKDTLIHESAQIHPNATVGARTIVEPNAIIGENVSIAEDCTICSGAVVGAPPTEQTKGKLYFDIEIGAATFIGCNSTIQYGISKVTKIGKKCWINHGCGIGHDVEIGDGVRVGLSSTISGYSNIGDGVIIGPGCTLTNRSEVGDSATVGIGSLVLHPVKRGSTVMGRPAEPRDQYLQFIRRLHELLDIEHRSNKITGGGRVISRKRRVFRAVIPSHKVRKFFRSFVKKIRKA